MGEAESASKWTLAEVQLSGVDLCNVASLSSTSGGHPFIETTLFVFYKLSPLHSTSFRYTGGCPAFIASFAPHFIIENLIFPCRMSEAFFFSLCIQNELFKTQEIIKLMRDNRL